MLSWPGSFRMLGAVTKLGVGTDTMLACYPRYTCLTRWGDTDAQTVGSMGRALLQQSSYGHDYLSLKAVAIPGWALEASPGLVCTEVGTLTS
jgi:hypothetical protein